MSGLILVSEVTETKFCKEVEHTIIGVQALRETRRLDADFILVDARRKDYALEALTAVRLNGSSEVYPLPVVLMGQEEELGPRLTEAADMVASMETMKVCSYSVQQIRDQFAPWLKRMRRLKQAAGFNGSENECGQGSDANLGVRLLRYLYVRQDEIAPIRGVWSIYGYHYPKLSMFLETEDMSVVKVLQYLESQALIEGDFQDKAYACARCGCNFLNFREVCPHCGSANLRVDDLVHHFRCGHVAPEPEFKDNGDLTCPKCSRPLTSLGTDYDKPSLVYTCRDCGHTFQ